MSEQNNTVPNLNNRSKNTPFGLNLQTEVLLVILIAVIIICFMVVVMMCNCGSEGMSNINFDKYQASYNQEQDNALGATPAGNALNTKVVDSWGEGLVGGFEAPAFWDGGAYNMNQTKGEGGVINTNRTNENENERSAEGMVDPLEAILHGGSTN
jgi:hypothetical protein